MFGLFNFDANICQMFNKFLVCCVAISAINLKLCLLCLSLFHPTAIEQKTKLTVLVRSSENNYKIQENYYLFY